MFCDSVASHICDMVKEIFFQKMKGRGTISVPKMVSKWISSYSCQEVSTDSPAIWRPIFALAGWPSGKLKKRLFKGLLQWFP